MKIANYRGKIDKKRVMKYCITARDTGIELWNDTERSYDTSYSFFNEQRHLEARFVDST